MSSSRSIAAARNRRAGDNASSSTPSRQPPGTSINSQAAFQGGRGGPMPAQRQCAPPQQQRFSQQQQQQPLYAQQPPYLQQQQQQQPSPYGQPPPPPQNIKLSVSDAIGLITLRLGKVEQTLIDQQIAEENGGTVGANRVPDGSVIIDKSVLNSLINRLDALEKKASANNTVSVSSSDFNAFKNETTHALNDVHAKIDEFSLRNDAQFEDVFKEIDALAAECKVNTCDFQLDSSLSLPQSLINEMTNGNDDDLQQIVLSEVVVDEKGGDVQELVDQP